MDEFEIMQLGFFVLYTIAICGLGIIIGVLIS